MTSLPVRLVHAEIIKLHRSSAVRLVYLLPLIFIALDFWFYRRPILSLRHLTPEGQIIIAALPIKIVASIWAGYFQPLLLALLPSLLVRPEHRFSLWKHLHIQPIPPWLLFFIKGLLLLILMSAVFLILGIGLWIEGFFLSQFRPILTMNYPLLEMAKVLGWMFLGSLPLLALYLWLSHRVNHGAVPISLGLIGLVLSISLSRGEMNPPWQRDFIPWILPYVCAQRAVQSHDARQEVHLAAARYKTITVEEKLAREIKAGLTEKLIPWVFPPPTPSWQLAIFSLVASVGITLMGALDVRRNR